MKKTLILMTLLGAASMALATEHWAEGVTFDPVTKMSTGAYTSYKHNSISGPDAALCWAASASNMIAWWQDRTEENGAIIIPKGTPRGYEVWEEVRLNWVNTGGFPTMAIEHWMHGNHIASQYEAGSQKSRGMACEGYYNRIGGADFNYTNFTFYRDFDVEGAMVTNYYISRKPGKDFAAASKYLADGFDNGMMFAFSTDIHVMTVYGLNYNEETGKADNFYWTDNNNSVEKYPEGRLIAGIARDGDESGSMWVNGAGARNVDQLYGIRTTGIHFKDYDVHINAEERDDVFSHYCNLIVDDGQTFALQYDLRDANEAGSPVTPYIYTYDGTEVVDKKRVTTGAIDLCSGTLALVDCEKGRELLDGGGSTRASISFKDSEPGSTRTLSVDRTADIAAEINIVAAGNNTLEVTQGHAATFGKLAGTGDLDKKGLGSAKVTDAVSLVGAIRVHEGSFIFGKDVALTEKTQLTILGGGSVQGQDTTLSLTGGVHENNGVMTLATTVKDGAVLKGSGSFAGVTVDNGGTLIVGNSPGRQTYTGDLSVNLGEIVFGVSGWDTAADEDHVGWGSGTYSNVVMNGNSLTLGGDSMIRFGVGNDALAALLGSDSGTAFSMTIATGIGNTDYFKSGVLDQLAAQTIFYVTDELGAVITNDAELNAGDSLNTRITDLKYNLVDNTALCVTGVYWAAVPMVPEPATGTMTLLALAGLCARRRRK